MQDSPLPCDMQMSFCTSAPRAWSGTFFGMQCLLVAIHFIHISTVMGQKSIIKMLLIIHICMYMCRKRGAHFSQNPSRKRCQHGKAKEQMTECTKSHFTLTKYVTVENMASSPIQNIKCSPKSNLREGKILFPSQRIWTCCYWFYKKWKRPHMFVCFIELTYHQLIAPNL